MKDIADFSMYEGSIPCPLCQNSASKTIMGNHWKCSACYHVFNEDGSDTGVECHCEKCYEKVKEQNLKDQNKLMKVLKKLEKAAKKAAKKKTTE